MTRPPHREDEKLLKSITGLRIMDDVGIRIRKLKHLKLHGKMVLADGVAAIVGSINFSPGTSATVASWRSKCATPTS
jgi:cardiolipin synthase